MRYRWIPRPVLALAAIAVLAGCQQDSADQETATIQPVETVAVSLQDQFHVARRYAGLILPRQSTDIGFERGGEIVELLVDEGQRVDAGQLLARLDDRLLGTERAELEAQLEEVRARIQLNDSSLARQLELQTRGFSADQRIDELTAEQRTLAANLARLDAALEANTKRLEQSSLTASFGGTVSQRFVDEGAVVTAGVPVVRIIESGALEARIGVPVRLRGRFTPGDAVTIEAAGDSHPGTVLAVGDDVTRATLTVPIRIAFPQNTDAVAGDQAYLRVEDPVERAGFWLPAAAITEGMRGLWTVYAMVGDSGPRALEARDVRVLYADEERVFVAGAVADGEQVVASGLHRLVPGQRVRPIDGGG